jgi:hypothetical protein
MNPENHLLPFRTSCRLLAPMSRIKRTTTLLLVCALALAVGVPAAAVAQDEPAGDQYVLDVPEGGNGEGAAGGSGDDRSDSVAAAATEGADDGGLPILLVVLVGTAAIGAGIAIMRRKKTT